MQAAQNRKGDTGMAPVVTIRQLLDSGVHFGHQTRRWNPKMKRFILTERSGSHIIDLQQSLAHIDKTLRLRQGDCRPRRHHPVRGYQEAGPGIDRRTGDARRPALRQPALARWPVDQLPDGLQASCAHEGAGGGRLRRHDRGYTKKELLIQKRELIKLQKSLGGIRNLTKTPSAIWVVDTKKEHLAIDEAHKLGIPVIAILDTNCDPDEVQYPIPGNDDAIRSVGLLTRIIADAAAEGLIARAGRRGGRREAACRGRWLGRAAGGVGARAAPGSCSG